MRKHTTETKSDSSGSGTKLTKSCHDEIDSGNETSDVLKNKIMIVLVCSTCTRSGRVEQAYNLQV